MEGIYRNSFRIKMIRLKKEGVWTVNRGEERASKFRKRNNVACTATAAGLYWALSSLQAKAK